MWMSHDHHPHLLTVLSQQSRQPKICPPALPGSEKIRLLSGKSEVVPYIPLSHFLLYSSEKVTIQPSSFFGHEWHELSRIEYDNSWKFVPFVTKDI
jgi:hypothetical protein